MLTPRLVDEDDVGTRKKFTLQERRLLMLEQVVDEDVGVPTDYPGETTAEKVPPGSHQPRGRTKDDTAHVDSTRRAVPHQCAR